MRSIFRAAVKCVTAVFVFGVLCSSYLHAHAGQAEQLRQVNLAIERNPKEQALYIRRGSVYSEAHQFALAEADFLSAETLGSPINTAYNRGLLYHQMGDLQRALDFLGLHIKHFPESALGYEARARVWRDKHDPKRAIMDLRQNLKLLPRPHPGNYVTAASLLQQLSATESALALLDEGIARLGTIPQIQRRAIALEQARGNTAGAITRMESLRAPLNANPSWKVEMASLLLNAEKTDEANKLLLAALEELADLRATPARAALQQEATELLQNTEHSAE